MSGKVSGYIVRAEKAVELSCGVKWSSLVVAVEEVIVW